jgi:hypothetical protein
MRYVTIDNNTYDLATEQAAAIAALTEAEIASAVVWECPQVDLASAEAVGFDGARETFSRLFAEPTDEQIRALSAAAGEAGDLAQVTLCRLALDGDKAARRECERAVLAGWAMH